MRSIRRCPAKAEAGGVGNPWSARCRIARSGTVRRAEQGAVRFLSHASVNWGHTSEATALSRLVRQPSLTERVFRQMRDAIVNRELPPGEPVSIEGLAGLLGVSRTPIREVLPALQQLNLIVQAENGSFSVAPINAGYAWEVYAVRSAIESLAVEVVAPRLTDADLLELRARALPATVEPDGDYSEMFGPDLGLHDFIHQKCPLGYLNALLDSVSLHRARLLELEHSLDPVYRRASLAEHLMIVEALERRDGKAARGLMQAHLDRVGSQVEAVAASRSGDLTR